MKERLNSVVESLVSWNGIVGKKRMGLRNNLLIAIWVGAVGIIFSVLI